MLARDKLKLELQRDEHGKTVLKFSSISPEEKSFSRFRLRWLSGGAVVLLGLAVLLWWSATRESPLDREINRRLAELRAAGEPVDAAGFARLFPNPSPPEDAGMLLTNILAFAEKNRLPASTPVVISPTSLARTEPFPQSALLELRAYHEQTKQIWNHWPEPWPRELGFASHWKDGPFRSVVPDLVQFRTLAQQIAVLASYGAEENDPELATQMLERGFRFTQTIQSDSLVYHMIKQASLGLMINASERCLNRIQFNEQQIGRLLKAMPVQDTNQFLNALRAEKCSGIWVFQEVKSGKGLYNVLSQSSFAYHEPWWRSLWRKLFSRQKAYDDRDFVNYLALYQSMLEARNLPPKEAMTHIVRAHEIYSSNAISETGQSAAMRIKKSAPAGMEVEAAPDILRTALAIERFRLARAGKIPAALPELVPDFLPAVPRDLFDGQPLRFKTLARGYVVYSIGADGVDDGGLEKTNNAAKYDVTITVER